MSLKYEPASEPLSVCHREKGVGGRGRHHRPWRSGRDGGGWEGRVHSRGLDRARGLPEVSRVIPSNYFEGKSVRANVHLIRPPNKTEQASKGPTWVRCLGGARRLPGLFL